MATQRQPKSYRLARRGADGKSSELIEAGARVVAEPGVVYSLVGGDSGEVVSGLRVRRAGDDLLVHGDGELLVTVAGFFALQGSGTAFEMPLVVADANGFELANGDSLITPETDVNQEGSSAPLMGQEGGAGTAAAASPPNPVLGLLALGIAGGGGGSGSGSGKPSGPQAIMADDGIGGAKISMHYDRNANGVVDTDEVAVSGITSSTSHSSFGQFAIPLEQLHFDPSEGMLKITGSGGHMLVNGRQVPVSGALEYKAYVTEAISAQDSGVQVVLTPLTTMAACLFEDMLAQGLPDASSVSDANLAALEKISRAFGLPGIDPAALSRQAPGDWSAERSIAERQVNALCVALVALGAGSASADGSLPVSGQQVMAAIARYIDAHPGIDFADAAQLRAAIVVVLPAAADAATLLAQSLSSLMNDIALFDGHGRPGSDAALSSLPSLAKTLSSFHAALAEGTLAADDPALASALASFDDALQAAVAKAVPGRAHAWVVVNENGAFIDQNHDGVLDDGDRVGGHWVAAKFSAGGNANLATKAVSIVVSSQPTSEVLASLSHLGADDSISVACEAQVAGNLPAVQFGAAAMQALLDIANAQGLKVDLSVLASAPGQSPVMMAGQVEAYSGTVGTVLVQSSGPLSGDAHASAWMFLTLDGEIAGPVQVFGFGEGSYASLNELSAHGLAMHDMTVGAIGNGSVAMAQFYVDIGDDLLGKTAFSSGSLLADAAGDGSTALIKFSASSGMLLANGDLHARGSGAGASSELRMETDGGDIEVDGVLDATASGLQSNAKIALSATRGKLSVGDVFATTGGGIAAVDLSASSAVVVGLVAAIARTPSALALPTSDGQASVTVNSSTDGVFALAAHALSASSFGQATVSLFGQNAAVVSFDANASALAAHSSAALSIRTDAGIAQVGRIDVVSAAEQSKASVELSGAGFAAVPAIFVHGTTTLHAAGLHAESVMSVSSTAGGVRFGDNVVLLADGVGSSTAFEATSSPSFAFNGDILVGAYGLDASSGFNVTAQTGGVKVDGRIIISADAGTSVDLGGNTIDNLDFKLHAQSGNVNVDGMVAVMSGADGGGALAGTGSRLAVSIQSGQGQVRVGQSLHAELSGYDSALEMSVHASGDVALEGGVYSVVDTQVRHSHVAILSEAGNVSVGSNIVMVDAEQVEAALLVDASGTAVDARDVLVTVSSRTGSVHLQGNLVALASADGSAVHADVSAGTLGNGVNQAGATVDGDVLARASGAGSSSLLAVAAKNSASDLWIKGALVADATGAFAEAQADAQHMMQGDGAVAGTGAIVVDGGLNSSAGGEGSRASVNVTSHSGDIHIGGDVSAAATADGAYASLLTSAAHGSVSMAGHVAVIADSGAGSTLGAVAVARVQLDALLAPASVDAVRAFDAASLELALARYGGVVEMGGASGAGSALLEFTRATAASVAIKYTDLAGEATLALDVPDHDYGSGEDLVGSARLDVSGFRAGVDKLYAGSLSLANITFITVADGSADFATRFYDAVLQFQQAGGYLIYAQESTGDGGMNTYVAYDGDGAGVTGLVVLHGTAFSNTDVLLSLPAPLAPPVWPAAAAVEIVLTPLSVTETVRTYDEIRVDAGTLQKKAPAIDASEALAVSHDVTLLASGASAELIADIRTTGTHPHAGDMTVGGGYLAQADGVDSRVTSTVTVKQGTLMFEDAVSTIASAMNAVATTTLTVNNQGDAPVPPPAATLHGSFSAQATADHSQATQTLHADVADISIALGVLAGASGYQSKATVSVENEAGPITTGDLLATTSGNESTAKLTLTTTNPGPDFSRVWNGAITTGSIAAVASGVQSAESQGASVTVSAHYTDLDVKGSVSALASGRNATATVLAESSASLQPGSSEGAGDVKIGTAVDSSVIHVLESKAAGDGSLATVTLRTLAGNISVAGSAAAIASGTDGDAQLHLSTGKVTATDPLQVAGGGDITVDQDARVTASGLHSNARLDIAASQGNVSMLQDVVLNATAENAMAGIAIVAGSNGNDYLQLPPPVGAPAAAVSWSGSVMIQRDLIASASGYASRAWMAATSIGGDLLLGGALQAFALAEQSVASADLQALNGGNLHIIGNVALHADRYQAISRVVVYAENGSVQADGGVSVGAAGMESHSSLKIHGGGDVAISGAVALASTGRQAEAEFEFGRIDGISSEGNASIDGSLALLASGSGSVVRASIGSDSDSALFIHGSIGIAATGAGAAVHAAIVGASTENRPLAVDISGSLQLLASGAGSVIDAGIGSSAGSVYIGGDVELTASGLRSQIRDDDQGGVDHFAVIRAAAGDLTVDGRVLLQASGDHASVKAMLAAPDGVLQIADGVDALASGFEGELHLLLNAANIVVHGDVNAKAVGAGSTLEFDWGLTNGGVPAGTLVDGRIVMLADSGSGDVAGSSLQASIAMLHLQFDGEQSQGVVGGLLVDARNSVDHATVDLNLSNFGGHVGLGTAGSAGDARLNFASLLASDITIGFTGTAGKATIGVHLDASDDATLTAPEIQNQIAVVSGFRADGAHDQLDFGALKLGSNTVDEYGSLQALVDAADQSLDDQVQVFAGRYNGDTYIAFDLDGDGFTGMIELDGVNQQQASYITSTGAPA